MVFSMEAIFLSALQRLPTDLAKALEQAGLDDASTLANYPRTSLAELRSRGFGVEPVGESRSGTGDLKTDVATSGAASFDVSTGGCAATMCILFFPVVFLSCFSLSPFTFPLTHLSHLLCLVSRPLETQSCADRLRSHTSNRTRPAQGNG